MFPWRCSILFLLKTRKCTSKFTRKVTETMGTTITSSKIINNHHGNCHNSTNLVNTVISSPMTTTNLAKENKIISLAKYFNNFYFKLLSTNFSQSPLPWKPLIVNVDKETIPIGLIPNSIEKRLIQTIEKSNLKQWFSFNEKQVEFCQHGNEEERSKVWRDILEEWRKDCDTSEELRTLRGWRGECYEIKPFGSFSKDTLHPTLFLIERSATPLFGMRQFGVDINGYVNHPQKGLCLWLQKRAKNKQTWPGCWDNMVGGGLSTTFSVLETAIKEAQEEACIPLEYLEKNLKPAGAVSFYFENERGLFPNTEFVFDLELPWDWVPENGDGEVEGFEMVNVQEALTSFILSPTFKTTSAPVTLDFLVRHGVINSDNEPTLIPDLLPLLHTPLTQLYSQILSQQVSKETSSSSSSSS